MFACKYLMEFEHFVFKLTIQASKQANIQLKKSHTLQSVWSPIQAKILTPQIMHNSTILCIYTQPFFL